MERSELSAPGDSMELTRKTMQRVPMTANGAKALRAELEKLKNE